MLKIERIVFVEADGAEVGADVEEGAGGVGHGHGELQDGGRVAVQRGEVGRLGRVLVVEVGGGVRLEADVVQHLERGQVGVVRDPLPRRRLIKVEVDGVEVSLGHVEQVVAGLVLVRAVAAAAVGTAACAVLAAAAVLPRPRPGPSSRPAPGLVSALAAPAHAAPAPGRAVLAAAAAAGLDLVAGLLEVAHGVSAPGGGAAKVLQQDDQQVSLELVLPLEVCGHRGAALLPAALRPLLLGEVHGLVLDEAEAGGRGRGGVPGLLGHL